MSEENHKEQEEREGDPDYVLFDGRYIHRDAAEALRLLGVFVGSGEIEEVM